MNVKNYKNYWFKFLFIFVLFPFNIVWALHGNLTQTGCGIGSPIEVAAQHCENGLNARQEAIENNPASRDRIE